ncbi:unnamed protein product [Strongylus vulgaris]|uniref:Uncharacterized protein n=1 Tax=Strongylus vulgaris TaxID=40348 RepID=A0A3P7JQM9_STRVU|nr:unnamed protein product [Strongylus vulgaris]
MTAKAKPGNPDQIDAVVRAQLPNATEDARLFDIVFRNMVHDAAVQQIQLRPAWSMVPVLKNFPKTFVTLPASMLMAIQNTNDRTMDDQ